MYTTSVLLTRFLAVALPFGFVYIYSPPSATSGNKYLWRMTS